MRNLKVTPNYSARTFTIRVTYSDGTKQIKYRTVRMSRDESQSSLNNTENDWFEFLKSEDYYLI